MKVIETPSEMQSLADRLRKEGKIIGLVPTMGYLHAGHISLIRTAREQCDLVIVSIFVNPVQFAPNEDFEQYPRDFEHDLALLREERVDYIFNPPAGEMYPDRQMTFVITEDLAGKLCGKSRPTHFRGVTTVVAKLFNIIKPHVAVFGQKDGQQALILKKMISDLNFDIRMIIAPTIREDDGLALSSRNAYLSADERQAAPLIFRTLSDAGNLIRQGESSGRKIEQYIRKALDAVPQFRIDYIAVVDGKTLEPAEQISAGTMIAVAVFCGNTRLIDNIMIDR